MTEFNPFAPRADDDELAILGADVISTAPGFGYIPGGGRATAAMILVGCAPGLDGLFGLFNSMDFAIVTHRMVNPLSGDDLEIAAGGFALLSFALLIAAAIAFIMRFNRPTSI